ncbi:acyl-CoA dehydrogenase [Halomicrobium salinisoli]|uniref:acyl-CoA dehydrogenase n=1 Tax=Halomicrobium salinisoli TaxID=2878391 RepID=UPI001CF04C76|nr:acyl-CoA dehydrogenase [Halomicrobium salinisoli]
MSNFKSGSGNLDFGGDSDGSDDTDDGDETDESGAEREQPERREPEPVESTTADAERETPTERTDTTEQSTSDRGAVAASDDGPSIDEYPYFVRRNNVGDERDTRLEIHVRDEVADREAEFRNAVAEQLGTGEVSKTDAREFALLAAYEHPEKVAELMEDEGFGALE